MTKTKQSLLNFCSANGRKHAKRLHGRDIYFAISEQCTDTEAVEVRSVDAVASSQEEAYTRIILHCLHICETAPITTHIIVRSPDTDVLVPILNCAQNFDPVFLFNTGAGDKCTLLYIMGIDEVKGYDLCSFLPALHCFTGSFSKRQNYPTESTSEVLRLHRSL